MEIACPIDNKDDSIQKISAVVAGGQSSGAFSGPSGMVTHFDGKWGYSGGYTTLSGNTINELSALLSAPKPPEKKWKGVTWDPLANCLALLAMPALGYIIIMLLFGLNYFTVERAILFIGAILFSYFALRQVRSIAKKEQRESEEIYDSEKSMWDNAIKKWQRLYYCHKHDIVFDPESGESCSPTSLKEFLYQPKGG